MRNSLTAIALAISLICATRVVQADQPEYSVMRTTNRIVLDGILDEHDWVSAPAAGDFAFPWHESGEKEQTEVKMLWDDTYLYVLADLEEPLADTAGKHAQAEQPGHGPGEKDHRSQQQPQRGSGQSRRHQPRGIS